MACAMGDSAAAFSFLKECLSIQRELGNKKGIATTLTVFAVLYCAMKQHGRALGIAGAVEALREKIGSPLPPNEREEYDHMVASVRAETSVDACTAAWSDGRAMTLEQAIEYALQDTDEILPCL
jgi:hypothetical protein